MRLYHVTGLEQARSIQERGFQETRDRRGSGSVIHGVFLSNRPLRADDGMDPDKDVMFILQIPAARIRGYELKDHQKPYREWCIPAGVVNEYFLDRTIYARTGKPVVAPVQCPPDATHGRRESLGATPYSPPPAVLAPEQWSRRNRP